eukprot:SAG31_NODE_2847_length_5006_cov_5.023028_3_plen_628_part_00
MDELPENKCSNLLAGLWRSDASARNLRRSRRCTYRSRRRRVRLANALLRLGRPRNQLRQSANARLGWCADFCIQLISCTHPEQTYSQHHAKENAIRDAARRREAAERVAKAEQQARRAAKAKAEQQAQAEAEAAAAVKRREQAAERAAAEAARLAKLEVEKAARIEAERAQKAADAALWEEAQARLEARRQQLAATITAVVKIQCAVRGFACRQHLRTWLAELAAEEAREAQAEADRARAVAETADRRQRQAEECAARLQAEQARIAAVEEAEAVAHQTEEAAAKKKARKKAKIERERRAQAELARQARRAREAALLAAKLEAAGQLQWRSSGSAGKNGDVAWLDATQLAAPPIAAGWRGDVPLGVADRSRPAALPPTRPSSAATCRSSSRSCNDNQSVSSSRSPPLRTTGSSNNGRLRRRPQQRKHSQEIVGWQPRDLRPGSFSSSDSEEYDDRDDGSMDHHSDDEYRTKWLDDVYKSGDENFKEDAGQMEMRNSAEAMAEYLAAIRAQSRGGNTKASTRSLKSQRFDSAVERVATALSSPSSDNSSDASTNHGGWHKSSKQQLLVQLHRRGGKLERLPCDSMGPEYEGHRLLELPTNVLPAPSRKNSRIRSIHHLQQLKKDDRHH